MKDWFTFGFYLFGVFLSRIIFRAAREQGCGDASAVIISILATVLICFLMLRLRRLIGLRRDVC
jgi:hypothetical protein